MKSVVFLYQLLVVSVTGPYAIKTLGFISDWLHVQGVATPFYMFKG